MQTHHGLARTGPATDASGPIETAAYELRLVGMQECHPILDRRRNLLGAGKSVEFDLLAGCGSDWL